jgi:uncharacterized damage-inducible protein DinB
MFSQSQFQTLFAYHWHIRSRLLACAAQLSETEYHAHPGYSHGAIHDLLFHLLRTEHSWRIGLETGQQMAPIKPEHYPTLAAIQRGVEQEQQAWQTLLDKLSAAEIEGDVNLTDWQGETSPTPRWRILQHLMFHGMQHHTELAHLLTAKGQSPGDIDFIFFE